MKTASHSAPQVPFPVRRVSRYRLLVALAHLGLIAAVAVAA